MDKRVSKSEKLTRIAGAWDGNIALSLMQAAPFRISDSSHLYFNSVMQASEVLSCLPNLVPMTVNGWVSRLSPEDRRKRNKAIRRLTWDGAEYKVTYAWRTDQGDEIWLEEHGRRKTGQGDTPSEIDGVIRNVSQSRREAARAEYLASHDDLTGVSNVKTTRKSLNHLIALCKRQQSDGAVLRLRISNIRDLNSVYGYETGDRVIAEFAKRLSRVMRFPDVLGRIDDADFLLLLYGASAEDVKAVSERLVFLLENSPVKTPHGGLFGEVSIGATQIGTHANAASEVLAQTKLALTKNQSSRVVLFDEAMASENSNVSQEITSDDILDALNQRRIQLAYQPIIYADTGRLHHFECLLRLRRVDGEVISAGRFIMAAERLGLIQLLDRRALELASDMLIKEPDVHLAVNVSAGTIQDAEAALDYVNALKALGPKAEQITIELTETVALEDAAIASDFSNQVRALGCQFAIDDFGSGYTTFQNLMAIEADTIKIDGNLIEGIASDPNKQTFVRMMVDLAQTFSVETVAEMVDNRADANILRRLGVNYLQGFMFGVPSAAPSWQKRAS